MGKAWEKVRAKGKRHYVLKSALIHAFLYAILATLLEVLWPDSTPPIYPLKSLYRIGSFALLGLIVGWWVGARTWTSNEKTYSSANEPQGS